MGRWTRCVACLLLVAATGTSWAQSQYVRDLLVCQSVSGKGQPVMPDTWFGAGVTSLTAWFRTLDMPAGTKAEVRWLLHGATLSTRTLTLTPGRFATDRLSLGMGETLPSGTYEVRVTVNGAVQAQAAVKVGGTRPASQDMPAVTQPVKPEPAGSRPTGLVRATRTPGAPAAGTPPAPGPVTAVAPEPPTSPRLPVTTPPSTSPVTPVLTAPDVPPVPATPSGGPAHALDVTPTAPDAVSSTAPVAPTGAAAPAPIPSSMPVPTAPGVEQGTPAASAGVAPPSPVPVSPPADGSPTGAALAPAGTPLGPRTGDTAHPTPLVGAPSVRTAQAAVEPLLPTPPRPMPSGSSPLAGVRAQAPSVPQPGATPLTGGGGRPGTRVMTPAADHAAPGSQGAAPGPRPMPREAEVDATPTEAPLPAPAVAPVSTEGGAPLGAPPVSPITPPPAPTGPPVPTLPVAPVSPAGPAPTTGEGLTNPPATGAAEGLPLPGGALVTPPVERTGTAPSPAGAVAALPPVKLRGPLTADVVAEDLLPVTLPNDAVNLYLVNLVPVTEPAGLQPLWLMRMPDGRTWPPAIGAGFGLYAGEAPAVSPASLLLYSDHQDGVVPLYEVPRDEALLHAARENQAAVLCVGRDIFNLRRPAWQKTAGAWRWAWLVRQVDVQAGDSIVACLSDLVRSKRAPEDFAPVSHEELFVLDEKGKRVAPDAIGPPIAAQVAASLGLKTEGTDMAALLVALTEQGAVGLSAWTAPAAGRYQVWAAMPFDKSRGTARVWTGGR